MALNYTPASSSSTSSSMNYSPAPKSSTQNYTPATQTYSPVRSSSSSISKPQTYSGGYTPIQGPAESVSTTIVKSTPTQTQKALFTPVSTGINYTPANFTPIAQTKFVSQPTSGTSVISPTDTQKQVQLKVAQQTGMALGVDKATGLPTLEGVRWIQKGTRAGIYLGDNTYTGGVRENIELGILPRGTPIPKQYIKPGQKIPLTQEEMSNQMSVSQIPTSSRQTVIDYAEKTGFEQRIEKLSSWEKAAALRSERAEEPFRVVPGLGGEQWYARLGRDVLALPARATVGLGEQVLISGAKIAATGEGLFTSTESTLSELGRAAKETPIAVAKSISPFVKTEKGWEFNPEGTVNLAVIAIGLRAGIKAQTRSLPEIKSVENVKIAPQQDIVKVKSGVQPSAESRIVPSVETKLAPEVQSTVTMNAEFGKGRSGTIKTTTYHDSTVQTTYKITEGYDKGTIYKAIQKPGSDVATVTKISPDKTSTKFNVNTKGTTLNVKPIELAGELKASPTILLKGENRIVQTAESGQLYSVEGKIGSTRLKGYIESSAKGAQKITVGKSKVTNVITLGEETMQPGGLSRNIIEGVGMRTPIEGTVIKENIVGVTSKTTEVPTKLRISKKPTTEFTTSKTFPKKTIGTVEFMGGELKDIPTTMTYYKGKQVIVSRPVPEIETLTKTRISGNLEPVRKQSMFEFLKRKEPTKSVEKAISKEIKPTRKETLKGTTEPSKTKTSESVLEKKTATKQKSAEVKIEKMNIPEPKAITDIRLLTKTRRTSIALFSPSAVMRKTKISPVTKQKTIVETKPVQKTSTEQVTKTKQIEKTSSIPFEQKISMMTTASITPTGGFGEYTPTGPQIRLPVLPMIGMPTGSGPMYRPEKGIMSSIGYRKIRRLL